jgi:hypothetical protein
MLHPMTTHELAKIRIQELHEEAARHRLARAASADRPRSIDIARLGERLRNQLFGIRLGGGRPTADASA